MKGWRCIMDKIKKILLKERKSPRSEYGAVLVYKKRLFGSGYPEYRKDKKDYGFLTRHLRKHRRKVRKNTKHPDLIYRAIEVADRMGWY